MDQQSQDQIYALCELARICSDAPILQKHRRTMVDTAIRAASNIVTAECTAVYNSTASILQWCPWWSERALQLYQQLKGHRTHRQTSHIRINGKRPWTVEHEYPVNIIKHRINNGASTDEIVSWMNKYGRAVVILHEENKLLLQSCKTETEAQHRYENITIVRHPHFEQQKEAG